VTTTHPQGTRGGAGQGFPAGEPARAEEPGSRRPGAAADRAPDPAQPVQRPLALTGAIAACAAAGAGLATLTLVAAIAWIAAVHVGLGAGLPGVLRTAIQLWLTGHHVGFDLHSAGKIGLLPLGLVLVPGAVLWRAGRWVVRRGGVQRLRHVGYAALALALPYGLLTGALAVASRTAASAPSPVEAAVAGFLLAFAAGGLGGARALAPWARLIGLLPDRARCLVVGVTGSLAVLAGAGALLTGVSLVAHSHEFSLASDVLSPGLLGSALLGLAALSYLPNAVIWAMAYMLGPGFAFGVGTVVAPAGTLLGPLPVFPMLAALPAGSPGPHPAPAAWTGLAVLAVPYLAGAFGGLLTVRTAPTPTV
jgi:putative intracellular protease/amidase